MCSCDCVLYWLSVLCKTFCLEEVHRQFDQQDQGQPPPSSLLRDRPGVNKCNDDFIRNMENPRGKPRGEPQTGHRL